MYSFRAIRFAVSRDRHNNNIYYARRVIYDSKIPTLNYTSFKRQNKRRLRYNSQFKYLQYYYDNQINIILLQL